MPCSWTARCWQEFRADNLTRASRDVLLTLYSFRGAGGIAWPSHATLATRAGCCVRTVQRALVAARDLGLVSWLERRVRAGWRWLRTSNSYRLTTPAEAVRPGGPTRRRGTTGQLDRGGESISRKKALVELMTQAALLPNLLEARCRVIQEKLLTGWRPGTAGGTEGQTVKSAT